MEWQKAGSCPPVFWHVLGYKADELTNRNSFEFMHPEDASHTAAALQRALTEPGLPVSVEYRFRHRDGTWHVLQSIGKSIPNQTSEGFIVINSRDITENRKLEEQFRQSQKMEAIGHLAGGVAHDFNNILAVIQMQAGLLEAAGSLLPTQRDYYKEIGKAVQRAASLTRQLLLFSRRQALQPHDLNLNDVIIKITKMLQRILGEDVRLQFNYSPAPLLIHADAGMMD
jgi:PAS domain S-box-containing protein